MVTLPENFISSVKGVGFIKSAELNVFCQLTPSVNSIFIQFILLSIKLLKPHLCLIYACCISAMFQLQHMKKAEL